MLRRRRTSGTPLSSPSPPGKSAGPLWVGMREPDRIEGDGGPGTKVEFDLHMLGIRMHETDETIEERHNPDGSTDWRLPGSVLGKVADRLVVEKMQSRDFRHSLENLKLLAEA